MSVVGLDVGTSRVKAVRFDEAWRAVDVESVASAVQRGPDGRREQDMNEVWSAASGVLRAVAQRSEDPVDLVSVTGQGDGCWLVDADGASSGPALLWNDSRAAPIIDRWQADGVLDAAFARNGCQGAPGLAHAQLTWLRDNEPDVLGRAATLLSCSSWIYAQLTGRRVLEVSEAANPFFDARKGSYDPDLLDLFGIPELHGLLPEVVSGSDRAAPVRTGLAAELGLDASTVITLAPYDVPATAVGSGVVHEGLAFAVLGTTLCVGTVADDPRLDRAPNGMTLPGAAPGRWLVAYATMVGTEVLDWAASLLGLCDAAAVMRLASTSTRPDLPLVLPYLSAAGERSPFLDTAIRGSISGLDTGHTPADVARATVDALSLVVTDCLRAAGTPTALALCGGGAASDLWCQSISDAIGLPVLRPDVAEVGALGAVICGVTDTGRFADLDTAIEAAVQSGSEFAPDEARTASYREAYRRFVDARKAGPADRA